MEPPPICANLQRTDSAQTHPGPRQQVLCHFYGHSRCTGHVDGTGASLREMHDRANPKRGT
jgi:hypothetical protein